MKWYIFKLKLVYEYRGKIEEKERDVKIVVEEGNSFELNLNYPYLTNSDVCILKKLCMYDKTGKLLMDRPVGIKLSENDKWNWKFQFKKLDEVDPRVSSVLTKVQDGK